MLRTKDLSKRFGDAWALQSLNLEIGAGEIYCLLGANGAGKTTTINLFLGFLEPTSGAAYVNGCEVARSPQAVRSELAYVAEQVSLYPTLTGLENLLYFTRLAARSAIDRGPLMKLLGRVGLEPRVAEMRVERYSKGMRQKVGLAIALAKEARGLLLDEPLSGLDPKAANEFCVLVRRLADDGAAVLIATHDLFRAREIATRIGIMKQGRLVASVAGADLSHIQLETLYLDHMREPGEAPPGIAA